MDDNMQEYIEVKGVRVNNLKNLSVQIPRDQLVVITGLSGSGKSSLAYDTLYAEGQRRYVESLSVYARQFVDKMGKPECDSISGIPPAIAIRQGRTGVGSYRSTVGTTTEVYDYLRMLFARVGKTFSPISGVEVKRHSVADVHEWLSSLEEGTKFMILAPIHLPEGRNVGDHLSLLGQAGYSRIAELRGDHQEPTLHRLAELTPETIATLSPEQLYIVIDRLSVSHGNESTQQRVGEGMEVAFFEGRGEGSILFQDPSTREWRVQDFSERFEADGITFEEPTDKLFSFNSPVGACPRCEGFSRTMGIDEDRVVPNKRLSVYDGAVACWRGKTLGEWQRQFIRDSASYGFPIHRPYYQLSDAERDLLWNGAEGVEGIRAFFDELSRHNYQMHYRILIARYSGRAICPECKGRRLRPEAFYVKVDGLSIDQVTAMSIGELHTWIQGLTLSPHEMQIARLLLEELRHRIALLHEIGLDYLTLDRVSSTLSGGESQRIALSTSLANGLIGSLYILDEPSIGLHPRDTHLLIDIVRRLADEGNSVLVVEHDEEMMRAADHLIDIGPEAGHLGGELVFQGSPRELPAQSRSHTVRYLNGQERIPWPRDHRPWNLAIRVKGAYAHNLKDVDVTIPLNVMTVVTGVSGSGKSTLMRKIFYEGVKALLERNDLETIPCDEIIGDWEKVQTIEYIDQDAIARNSRSNPATYIGAYEEIRKLYALEASFAGLQYHPGDFSLNTGEGRCPVCKGEGSVAVEMQFMADMTIECEECHGRRFKEEYLQVTYEGVNIYELLNMSVDEAVDLMNRDENWRQNYIVAQALRPLQEVGLGYVKLGQSTSTLSGGEAQRLKLATYLKKRVVALLVFDEPTTGLHPYDVHTLLKAFDALIEQGHTVVVVEHNLDLIKCADHLIDLGPEGGDQGGSLLYQGAPEGVMEVPASYTGKFLKEKYHADTSYEQVTQ